MAIACETVLRAHISRFLIDPANPKFFKMVNRIFIGQIVDQWPHLGFANKGWRSAMDSVRIKELFKLRNDLAHRGDMEGLKESQCREIAKAARSLVLHADSELSRL